MAEKPTPKSREVRLKAALKANMAKRKAQARARVKKTNGQQAGKDTSNG